MESQDSTENRRFSSRPPSYRTAQKSRTPIDPNIIIVQNEELERALIAEEGLPKKNTKFETVQLIFEFITSAFLDFGLLIFEVAANITLGIALRKVEYTGAFYAIIIFTLIPSLLIAFTWIGENKKKKNQHFGYCWMLMLIFIGYPSPVFTYLAIWLTIFISSEEETKLNSKILGNKFRVIQACFSSIPILLINLSVLFGAWENEKEKKLDFAQFDHHPVSANSLAAVLSFLNVIRAASLFNDRKSFTISFFFVGLPFIVGTTLTRVLGLSFMLAFFPKLWSILTFSGMFLCNLVLFRFCRKPPPKPTSQENLYPLTTNSTEERAHSFWSEFPKHIFFSIFSIICPVGYSNDIESGHSKMRGGILILFNYFFNTLPLAIALGFTIYGNVPNEIHGLSLHQPDLTVTISGTKIKIPHEAMDFHLSLPDQELNLASIPSPSLHLNTEESDMMFAFAIPMLFVFLSLPWAVMRAAIMELECIVVHRKDIESESDLVRSKIIFDNVHDFRVKCRIYTLICCSMFGMLLFTFALLGGLGFFFKQLSNH